MTAEIVRTPGPTDRVAWLKALPYISLHLWAVVGLFFYELTPAGLIGGLVWYLIGMFAITAGFHRYFAHRGYKTSRAFQFVLALLGTMVAQKGPLWWAGHHRHHHKHSDGPQDVHSPRQGGFMWAHQAWILVRRFDPVPYHQIKDFAKYPELKLLGDAYIVPPAAYFFIVWAIAGIDVAFYMVIVTTVLLYHATYCINSVAHLWGTRRYETQDDSRNNLLLALLTHGEGWHNNHHFYPSTARNGFFWWEIDLSYYVLKVLSWLGLVWDLRQPPKWVLEGKPRKYPARAAVPPKPEQAPAGSDIGLPAAATSALADPISKASRYA